MMKSIYENYRLINFIQPYSGLEVVSYYSSTTGSTRGYSSITTSWFESGNSLKGLKLNSPGLSEAQPWVLECGNNRRNHLAVQSSVVTMRRDAIKTDNDDLLNPFCGWRDRLSDEDFKRYFKIV